MNKSINYNLNNITNESQIITNDSNIITNKSHIITNDYLKNSIKSIKTVAHGICEENTIEPVAYGNTNCTFDKNLKMTDIDIRFNNKILKKLQGDEVNNSGFYNFIKYLVEEVESLKKIVKKQQKTIDSFYYSDEEIIEV